MNILKIRRLYTQLKNITSYPIKYNKNLSFYEIFILVQLIHLKILLLNNY